MQISLVDKSNPSEAQATNRGLQDVTSIATLPERALSLRRTSAKGKHIDVLDITLSQIVCCELGLREKYADTRWNLRFWDWNGSMTLWNSRI